MDRLSWIVMGTVVVLAFAWVLITPTAPAGMDDDHRMFVNTVEAMTQGSGYYEAMAGEVERHYGGPPGSVRAFRMPTMFLVWRMLPSAWLWPLFAGFVAVGAGFVAVRSSRPHAGVLVTVWLLVIGYTLAPEGWIAQWAAIEFWAVPLALAAAWRHEEGDDLGAAALATAAALVRELTLPLLVLGLMLSFRGARRTWPWAAGLATWVVAYGIHAALSAPWIAGTGAERELLGSAHVGSVVEMATVNGPWPLAVAWAFSLVVGLRDRRWMHLPLLAMPLFGVLVDRDYWGILTVPAVFVVLVGTQVRWPVREMQDASA